MAQFRTGSGSYQAVRQLTMQPSSIPGGNTSVETITPTGFGDITTDSSIQVTGPSLETGLKIVNARMSATGVIELTIDNFTTGTIVPASQTFNVIVL